MIQRTSAVTTTVLGEVKIVCIIVLSATFFGAAPDLYIEGQAASAPWLVQEVPGLPELIERKLVFYMQRRHADQRALPGTGEGRLMTMRMALGCAITMLGFVLYSHIKLASTKPPATKTNAGLDAGAAVDALVGAWESSGRGQLKAVRPGWPTLPSMISHRA